MELTPELVAQIIERSKLHAQLGVEASNLIPELLKLIEGMKIRLDAAMQREAGLRQQIEDLQTPPESRAAKRKAEIRAQMEKLVAEHKTLDSASA